MEKSCKFLVVCTKAQMLQAGFALEGGLLWGKGAYGPVGFIFSLPPWKRLLADPLCIVPQKELGF